MRNSKQPKKTISAQYPLDVAQELDEIAQENHMSRTEVLNVIAQSGLNRARNQSQIICLVTEIINDINDIDHDKKPELETKVQNLINILNEED